MSKQTFPRRLMIELRAAPRAFFWLGVVWFALGTLITFYPGAEQWWFAVSAVLTAFGFLVPRPSYRAAAFVLVALSLFWVWSGHQRSVEYQQFLERNKAVLPPALLRR